MKSAVSIFRVGGETASLSLCFTQFILIPWRRKQKFDPKRPQVSVKVHRNTPYKTATFTVTVLVLPVVSLQKRVYAEPASNEALCKLPRRITFMAYINVLRSSSIRRSCAPYSYKNIFCSSNHSHFQYNNQMSLRLKPSPYATSQRKAAVSQLRITTQHEQVQCSSFKTCCRQHTYHVRVYNTARN